jgi:hypothetical protein
MRALGNLDQGVFAQWCSGGLQMECLINEVKPPRGVVVQQRPPHLHGICARDLTRATDKITPQSMPAPRREETTGAR